MNSDGVGSQGPGKPARPGGDVHQGEGQRPAGPPRRRPGDKPFIPFVRFEDVVARCGHVEKFGILPDNKDRFREARRKKAMSRDCKTCRGKRVQEEQEAAEVRRAEKEKRKMEESERQSSQTRPSGPQTSRLPDGSQFQVRYDAARQEWNGTLTIPGAEGAPLTFTGSLSGLFPLLASLDRQYRATLS